MKKDDIESIESDLGYVDRLADSAKNASNRLSEAASEIEDLGEAIGQLSTAIQDTLDYVRQLEARIAVQEAK